MLALLLAACGEQARPDRGDAAVTDARTTDAASPDATVDAGQADTGPADAGATDPCAPLCAQVVACGVPVTAAECATNCQTSPAELRSCLLACNTSVCEDLLRCTTACAAPGNPAALPYGACADGCRPGVTVCLASVVAGGPEHAVCAPFCDPEGRCPAPDTGTAVAQCDTAAMPPVCSLNCNEGRICPDDMVCLQGTCTWPR